MAVTFTYSVQGADLTSRGEPERVRTMPVSADYFRVLRAHPILGRTFDRADERANTHVAVIRDWSRTSISGRRPTCSQADRTRSTTTISASSRA
jgi:hypothetical protein